VGWERQADESERIGAHAPVAAVIRQMLTDYRSCSDAPAPQEEPLRRLTLERYLSPAEVEERLGLPKGYAVDHWRERGGVKIGKYVRFPEPAVAERLQRSRRNGH